MKADPRRREWEAAPIWMRCTCAEEGELGEARQLPFEGKLEKAKEWREQANDLFKQVRGRALWVARVYLLASQCTCYGPYLGTPRTQTNLRRLAR